MKRSARNVVLLLLACAAAWTVPPALAAEDDAAALEAGRTLTAQWLAGETAALWARMGPQMRAALGSEEALAETGAGMLAQLGEEQEVLSERVSAQQGVTVYQRVGRWSAAPMPIVVTWALGPDGTVEGFHVRPAPAENLGSAVPAGETPDGRLPADKIVAQYLEEFVDQRRAAPGVVVGLFDKEGTRFVAHGDAGDGRAPDAGTVFEAGSITKGLTGLLLAQMAAAGDVRLEQPIGTLVPDGIELDPLVAAVTLEELATHRSGLPRLAGGPEMQARMSGPDPYAGSTPAEIFADLARVDPAVVASGRGSYAYSNLGSALLGQLLARAGGQPYGTLLAERVFAPLGLAAPTLDPADVEGRRAVGHQGGERVPPWTLDAYAPAGAWQASAREALALAQALLAAEPAWVPTALQARPHGGELEKRIGLAWHHADIAGRAVTWHNGGTAGSSSFLAMVPAEGIAIVVLANAGGGVADSLAGELLAYGR
ncbi:serine hydrolase domain-containing protein [Thioalkalivibrio sp. XN8]|uniref:serine hydrolase domain-containing protein n=1 Tax=Thioalkalivibrio sp. XN8 TaxID=2712863 RepID=UPI0013ED69CB|nr:serine hydrolase domain-containing protein [Thioalkalivibrio sp. XN8]NGP53411.1 beta-lactamase family protein [Thioalkalivibrio sp. XN8]